MSFFHCSEVEPAERILLRHAREAFGTQARAAREWRDLGYVAEPDVEAAVAEYDSFARALETAGGRLEWLPAAGSSLTLDAIYVRDGAVVSSRGIILANMGKRRRAHEPAALESYLRESGLPIAGSIGLGGYLEGGDVAWVDARSVAVGIGYRTNLEGARQLRQILGDLVDEVFEVHLPHHRGPADVFHLMSIFSPVQRDLAVVFSPLMPVVFREWLLQKGYRFVEVPEDEFETMGCNVLAVSPAHCVMLEGNPHTQAGLQAAGLRVTTYPGDEISRKGCGGPTCLTLPLGRAGA